MLAAASFRKNRLACPGDASAQRAAPFSYVNFENSCVRPMMFVAAILLKCFGLAEEGDAQRAVPLLFEIFENAFFHDLRLSLRLL